MEYFGLKLGQDLGNRAAHPYQKFRGVPPRAEIAVGNALSYEHIEIFTKDSEVRRDLGNRVSPVNRAHTKRLRGIRRCEEIILIRFTSGVNIKAACCVLPVAQNVR